jgi:hypothetical protein
VVQWQGRGSCDAVQRETRDANENLHDNPSPFRHRMRISIGGRELLLGEGTYCQASLALCLLVGGAGAFRFVAFRLS